MKKLHQTFIILLCFAGLSFIVAMLIPVSDLNPIAFGLTVAMAELFIGAAIIFLKSLNGFSLQLKKSYRLICLGIVFLAIAQLQVPLAGIFELRQSGIYRNTVGPLVFITAITVIFGGTRSFARLFKISNLTTSWLFALGMLVICAVGVRMMPHGGPTFTGEAAFDTINAGTCVSIVFFSLASLHILQIKQAASVAYTRALAWLFLGLVAIDLASIVYLSYRLLLGEGAFFLEHSAMIMGGLFVLAGMALAYSATCFAAIQTDSAVATLGRSRNFFGDRNRIRSKEAASSLDIVIFAATLISDSRTIDPILDPVRIISSTHQRRHRFSAKDQAALMEAYLTLEDYLVTKENVRVFDQISLREKITKSLELNNDTVTFWHELPQPK